MRVRVPLPALPGEAGRVRVAGEVPDVEADHAEERRGEEAAVEEGRVPPYLREQDERQHGELDGDEDDRLHRALLIAQIASSAQSLAVDLLQLSGRIAEARVNFLEVPLAVCLAELRVARELEHRLGDRVDVVALDELAAVAALDPLVHRGRAAGD